MELDPNAAAGQSGRRGGRTEAEAAPGATTWAGEGGRARGPRPAPPAAAVSARHPPAVVVCGHSHTLSLSRRGEVFSWGLASSGELGYPGAGVEAPLPRRVDALSRLRVVSVSAGGHHSMCITEDGALWTCGRGRHGQLGHGEFVDEAPLERVASLAGVRVVSTAAGAAHSLALGSDGTLYSWGCGDRGQLGHGALEPLSRRGGADAVALAKPWRVASLCPRGLAPGDRVTAVHAGARHSLALTVDGGLKVFGCNRHGQLGTGGRASRTAPAGERTRDAWSPVDCALWSLPGAGPDASAVRVVQAAAGAHHTVVLCHVAGRPTVVTFGRSCHGQLGHGDVEGRPRPTAVEALQGRAVAAVLAGGHHSAAVGREGEVWVWGRGDSGQLGTGDTRNRWTPERLPGVRAVHPDRTLRRRGGNDRRIPKSAAELAASAAAEAARRKPRAASGTLDACAAWATALSLQAAA